MIAACDAAGAPVRQLGDPVLWQECAPVDAFDDALASQAERMIEICRASNGVGLAAPQVGIVNRMFVMLPPDEPAQVVVNPRVVVAGSESDSFDEGCLSIAAGRVWVPVIRPTSLYFVAQDLTGEEVEGRLDGFGARIFQHELDHLDGVTILHRATPAERRRALGRLRTSTPSL